MLVQTAGITSQRRAETAHLPTGHLPSIRAAARWKLCPNQPQAWGSPCAGQNTAMQVDRQLWDVTGSPHPLERLRSLSKMKVYTGVLLPHSSHREGLQWGWLGHG